MRRQLFVLSILIELLWRVASASGSEPTFAVTNAMPQFSVENKVAQRPKPAGCPCGVVCPCVPAPGGVGTCGSYLCPANGGKAAPTTYAEVRARVAKGERVVITLPGTFPDAPAGFAGVYECFSQNGQPVMRPLAAFGGSGVIPGPTYVPLRWATSPQQACPDGKCPLTPAYRR